MSAVEFAIIVNSALYHAGVIAVAISINHPVAWRAALFNLGALYLGYVVQTTIGFRRPWQAKLWLALTVAQGAVAGIALLVG